MRRKAITPKTEARPGRPFLPPIKPKLKGGKLNTRIWNAGRDADHNWIFAIDLNCIQTKRPASHWQEMKRAMRHLAKHSHVLEHFPNLDVCSPQAIYYINYCIQTMSSKGIERLKAALSREVAKRVFHSCLMEESIERVKRTRAAYMEIYGFVQGRRTLFGYRELEDKQEPSQDEAATVVDIRQRKLEGLREELAERQEYHELEDEGLIFRLQQQIHDLEYQIETDEWPEVIGDGGEQ